MPDLDPHQRPPESVRNVYKTYQKLKAKDLNQDEHIIDLADTIPTSLTSKVRVIRQIDLDDVDRCFQTFWNDYTPSHIAHKEISVYEHIDMPGLHIIPSLLPPEIQQILLSRLLHRDLSNPAHLTNIHTHYKVAYPPSDQSFFTISPSHKDPVATPLDPCIHKPLTISQLLNKKMRWTTLGGQYDWTAKRYPDVSPPSFPPDIRELLNGVFKDTKAEAAIVNLYSPGDTLSVHRDVAETSATGLVSISLGCDAIFVIGTKGAKEEGEDRVLALRLRSGSAVYMSGASRFAWHGVPQIVAGTCPNYLKDWPGNEEGGLYEHWKGWMENKRINLNVRQMWD